MSHRNNLPSNAFIVQCLATIAPGNAIARMYQKEAKLKGYLNRRRPMVETQPGWLASNIK